MGLTISKHYIEKGYDIVNKNKYFRTLNNIYKQIPSTTCLKCGKCCVENPDGSFIEFLNFLNKLKTLYNKKEVVEKVIKNVMTSLVRRNDCSFLDGNRCLIYDVRPFSCRIFGIQSKSSFDKNFSNIEIVNKQISYMFKSEYNLDVIELGRMNYCDNVKAIGKRKINDNDIESLIKRLYSIEAKFHLRGFPLKKQLDSYEAYIAYLVVDELNINYKDWGELRVKISKEIRQKNESETLEEFMKDIRTHNFQFLIA